MPPNPATTDPSIRIASALDPVAAADCRAGLAETIASLPTGSAVSLSLSDVRATVPSLQLFFGAHRSLSDAGHRILLGAEGAAVLGSSNLATVSMTKVDHD